MAQRISLTRAGLPDQLRVAGHKQRRSAADVRRGHAGSVHRVFQAAGDEADDLLAGGHEVGLGAPVAGRPAAGEEADAVGVRLLAVGRADGDHRLAVARVGDADTAVTFVVFVTPR